MSDAKVRPPCANPLLKLFCMKKIFVLWALCLGIAAQAQETYRFAERDTCSLYLDIYQNGNRRYEFLKLYLVPEVDEATKMQNQNTIKVANAIKAKRVIEIANGKAGVVKDAALGKMLLSDWLDEYKAGKAGNNNQKAIGRLKKHLAIYTNGKEAMRNGKNRNSSSS